MTQNTPKLNVTWTNSISRSPVTHMVIIVLFACLIYSNSLQNGYSFDDHYVIDRNPKIEKGFSGIEDIFITRYHEQEGCVFGYRPIVQTAFAIEYEFFDENPFVSHLINLLLYSLVLILVYIFLKKLFRNQHILFPLIITLLFAAHPVHTEAVVNVKNRDTLLSMIFGILALLSFMRAFRKSNYWYVIPGILCFVLAYFAKEEASTLAAIIPLTLYFYISFEKAGLTFIKKSTRISVPRVYLLINKLPPARFSVGTIVFLSLFAVAYVGSYTMLIIHELLLFNILHIVCFLLLIVFFFYKKIYRYKNIFKILINPLVIAGLLVLIAGIVTKILWLENLDLFFYAAFVFGTDIFSGKRIFVFTETSKYPIQIKRITRSLSFPKVSFRIGTRSLLVGLFLIVLGLLVYFMFNLPNNFLPSQYVEFFRTENPLFVNDPLFNNFTLGISSLAFYIKKLFFPHPLGFYYGFNMIPAQTWTDPELIISLLIHAALLIYALVMLRKKHILSFAILYYFAAISIFTNFFFPVAGIVAERFLFSASLGFCIFIAWVIIKIFKIKKGETLSTTKKILVLSTLILILIPYSYKTITRNKDWKDYGTLFAHDTKSYLKNSVKAQYIYAQWLSTGLFETIRTQGNSGQLIDQSNEVIGQLVNVANVDPTYKFAWNDMGVIYSEVMNQNRRAIAQYEQALGIDTTYAEAWYNAAVSWLREYDTRMAELCFEKAMQYDPKLLWDINELADTYFMEGRYVEPFVLYPIVMHYDSTVASPVKNLGLSYLASKDTTTAVTYLKKAFELNPTDTQLGMDLWRYFTFINEPVIADYYKAKVTAYQRK